jgi:peroxiredoxin Q/BCP
MKTRAVFTALLLLVMTSMAAAVAPQDFSVATADHKSTFTLSSARGRFVALHFLLKTECPICLKHTRDYAQKASRLPQVQQVFLKPDAEPAIEQWEQKLKASTGIVAPAIYRDPDAGLARAFGIPDGYQFHGQVVHFPALVLLDPQGKEVFRYVGKSNMDRFSFEALEAKLAELHAR